MTPETIAWLVLAFCSVIGLVGIFTPGVPGTGVIFIGALVHKLILPEYLSWWTVGIVAFISIVTMILDYFGSVVGAKWGGATKWGLLGALVGLGVGIFFFPFGVIIGPVLGTLLAEVMIANRSVEEGLKSGVGAGIGLLIASVIRVPLALASLGIILIDCFVIGGAA